ncbi:MAG TPA: dTDP-4-dehydrorhamnose 3,5-epimerase [Pyrinomonadaceae bacterium]|nr:dTDP-4-dehydrorhamnose 3,5-epimerase [Pyrinomonadaceae bacterium]
MGITFRETKLAGAFVIEPESFTDERGIFARSFSEREFASRGINPRIAECNISVSNKRYTIRGMHFQTAPCAQAKLVRCTKGAIYDVIIDLRPDSPTFKQWIGEELTAENRRMLYVPEGFAHGFQTLADNTEVFYQVSDFYAPESAGGVRWNDPAFGIRWPAMDGVTINERDQNYPNFKA